MAGVYQTTQSYCIVGYSNNYIGWNENGIGIVYSTVQTDLILANSSSGAGLAFQWFLQIDPTNLSTTFINAQSS
jgi:hypothetical protein